MGVAAPLIYSAIAAAAASTVSYINTRNTERKQNNILSQQLANEKRYQDQANNKTQQLLDNRAKSTPDADRNMLLDRYRAALASGSSQALAPTQQVGNVSDAYKKSGSDAALGITDYGQNFANLVGNIDAPKYQRQDEAAQDSRFQSSLSQLGNFEHGDDSVYYTRLHAIQRNPWLDILANGLMAAAKSKMGGMGGTPGGGANAGTWAGSDTPTAWASNTA